MARHPERGRRVAAVAARLAVVVVSASMLACCVPPELHDVYQNCLHAQAVYDGCRAHRLNCDDQRAAYYAARDAYHAAEAANP